jgi:hypothetical protein
LVATKGHGPEMALPAPRSPLASTGSVRVLPVGDEDSHRLAPARGITAGLVLAFAVFWAPLAVGLWWLLA